MKHIVIFGAGKSSTYLVDYIVRELPANDWTLTLIDADRNAALSKTQAAPRTDAVAIDVSNDTERKKAVASADIVISLLPPSLHYLIALDCLEFRKDLLTASYIDPKIEALRSDIEKNGLLFLCEMGLDPGIDHMSAMKIIHALQQKDAAILSFRSHCGGLVAPESDDNPWHYKVSWNPRNIVLAGKTGAIYKEAGKEINLPYDQLFEAGRTVNIQGLGQLSFYPNRETLSYQKLYQLHEAADFVRTTLRYPEFCAGWKKLVQWQLTDEHELLDTDGMSLRRFFSEHIKKKGIDANGLRPVQYQLEFLGLHDDNTIINKGRCSAADVLQWILENRLALKPDDKDMIVMLHEIGYQNGETMRTINSSLIVKGEDNVHTAMAKTVGLPLAIATKNILHGNISVKGLHIPIIPEIYEPVLRELETVGIRFEEITL